MRNAIALICLLGLAGAVRAAEDAPLPKMIDFDRDVRPILSNTCFTCHGPDEQKRKSKLRLDLPPTVRSS
jgi:hypothetical protein